VTAGSYHQDLKDAQKNH